ncbi:hypothetical protein [Erythrobacter sp.]|uniref:hypothetical protein n=1 Tax=Erythrobacter sp. TaxID=1042 RepID=UPI0025D50E0E|nr:hypothetical protein [Erythrobacter sp.]
MRSKPILAAAVLIAALALPACKPPPTDAAVARADGMPLPAGPSVPLPSPDTTGAVWAASGGPVSDAPMRLVYGIPGEPVLLALECLEPGTPDARLRISRQSPADKGAGALLALIGNGYIGRFPVDSTELGGRLMWQGEVPADAQGWNALIGQREATATVPGAGLVRLNPSPLPMQLVEACRGNGSPDQPAGRA